jgi:hypothetical protein
LPLAWPNRATAKQQPAQATPWFFNRNGRCRSLCPDRSARGTAKVLRYVPQADLKVIGPVMTTV